MMIIIINNVSSNRPSPGVSLSPYLICEFLATKSLSILCGKTSTVSSTRFVLQTGSPDPGPFDLPSESFRLFTGAAAEGGCCRCGGGGGGGGGLSFLCLSAAPLAATETGGGRRRRGWPASRSGWDSDCAAAGNESWPESEAVVSPENLGRNPVRLAQVEGGNAGDSGAGGGGPGFGSELVIFLIKI